MTLNVALLQVRMWILPSKKEEDVLHELSESLKMYLHKNPGFNRHFKMWHLGELTSYIDFLETALAWQLKNNEEMSQMAVDLYSKAQPPQIITDKGTYTYNGPTPVDIWNAQLKEQS